jgi:hypothetical protein
MSSLRTGRPHCAHNLGFFAGDSFSHRFLPEAVVACGVCLVELVVNLALDFVFAFEMSGHSARGSLGPAIIETLFKEKTLEAPRTLDDKNLPRPKELTRP